MQYKKIVLLLLFLTSVLSAKQAFKDFFPVPNPDIETQHYICYKTTKAPVIDGDINDECWQNVDFTNDFIDIEGNSKPKPKYKTYVKMLWDENYLYIAAKLEEPHLWASLKKRDSIVYFDNDFEVFIDPDWDTHNYYELEVNAFNTVWDLLITQPYRDGGPAVHAWDIANLKTAVKLNGTINNPTDIDNGWCVEIAIPFKILGECYNKNKPEVNDLWKVNFSRVQWELDYSKGKYQKLSKPESNWVWSAQGIINMHYPEMWGIVQFAEAKTNIKPQKISFKHQKAFDILRKVYYAERDYNLKNDKYTSSLKKLKLENYEKHNLMFYITPHLFEVGMQSGDDYIFIQQDGRIFINNPVY